MRVREGGSYEIKDGKPVRVVDPPKPGSGPVEPLVKPEKPAAPEKIEKPAAPAGDAARAPTRGSRE